MKSVKLYTDGSCSKNPGPGGWGAVLIFAGREKELCGGEPHTTNNRMELTAAIEGLRALKEPCIVDLYTDSQYLSRSVSEGWMQNWKAKGWQKGGQDILNKDLWVEIDRLLKVHDVRVHWVKGHADNAYNNRCDALAVAQTKIQAGDL